MVTSFSFLNSTPVPRISATAPCCVTHVLKTALSTHNQVMAHSQGAAWSRVARGSVLGEASLWKASGVRELEHGNHMAAARTDWPAVSHLRTPGAGSQHPGDCQTATQLPGARHRQFPFSSLSRWTLLTAAPAPIPSWPCLYFQTCSLTRHCTSSTLCTLPSFPVSYETNLNFFFLIFPSMANKNRKSNFIILSLVKSVFEKYSMFLIML